MSLFQYEALNQAGKKFTAVIDADSLQDAKLKLHRQEIMTLRVAPVSGKEAKCHLPRSELMNLTLEWARLLQAGLPLYEVLVALEEKYKGQKAQKN